ncbi:MAG: SEL1-like repeat protein [Cyclobacteriaceae bacterium]
MMKEPIYRPQHKPENELKEDFVIRLSEYEKIMTSIRSERLDKSAQHMILQGMRGMGKTTLMHRVFYQVKEEFRGKGLIPVIFGEEQYGVRTLYKLWEQVALYLEDNESEYAGIWYELQAIQELDDYPDRCFEVLKAAIEKHQHRLLLLIDNFGIMVDKFARQEQQRLREILIDFKGLKIIGGSAVLLESFYRYDKSFFDFYKVIKLDKLTSKEAKTLLLRLGEKKESSKVKEIIQTQPGRLESLRILTGGVPRTIVMLFEIFMDEKEGNSINDLKKLLDDVTPLYKHRMDELPSQQQEIVDKLALNWDGMNVGELAKKTRMESKAVSAQLSSLVKSNVVHAEKSTGKNKYYQLQERFFNIWYLMQYAPRNSRQKVIWLTRFLELWCDKMTLSRTASDFSSRLQNEKLHPEYIKAMTYAYATADGLEIENRDELIESARNMLTNNLEVIDENFPMPHEDFYQKFKFLIAEKKFSQAKVLINKASLPDGVSYFYNGYLYDEQGDMEKAEEYYLKAIEKEDSGAMYNLALLYKNVLYDYEKAEKYYLKAVEKDHLNAMYNLAFLYENVHKDYKKAEEYYLKAVEKGHSEAITNLGLLYNEVFKDYIKAEKYYLLGMENKDILATRNMLVLIIDEDLKQYAEKGALWLEGLLQGSSEQVPFLLKIKFLLWANKPSEATSFFDSVIDKMIADEKVSWHVQDVLSFAVAKGLKNYVFNLFQKEQYQLKDRFKVLYFALMKIMEEEHPNEIKKMGRELEEPVMSMVEEIKALEKKYSD